jgi:hypothetical protein
VEICGKLLGRAVGKAVDSNPFPRAFREGAGVSQQPLRACSACAGDYEDPDRTAWPEDPEEDDSFSSDCGAQEGVQDSAENDDEFPAQ